MKVFFHSISSNSIIEKIEIIPSLYQRQFKGEGVFVKNANGERFMLKYDPHAELAPRDIVARSIANEIPKSDQDLKCLFRL